MVSTQHGDIQLLLFHEWVHTEAKRNSYFVYSLTGVCIIVIISNYLVQKASCTSLRCTNIKSREAFLPAIGSFSAST